MSVSATVLLLTGMSGATPVDITPVSLSVEPRVVNLGDASYDWTLQLGPSASGVDLASTSTATCDTVMSTTNNGKDTVPDCRFD